MSVPDDITTMQAPSTPLRHQKNPKKPAPAPVQYLEAAARKYDLPLIRSFLDMVFSNVEDTDKDQILTWVVDKHRKPIYPVTEDEMYETLSHTTKGKALYFGTATCRPDNAGALYNRQALFERLHVIVLDDIGTKGSVRNLPENLIPTYIVESSEGNYQYGYVLETPIDNLDAAKALVTIMYDAGIADAGGKMPNKLVRLPEGINGKKDATKCHFVTKLISMDGPKWTPQGLLDALNCGAAWEEIAEDSLEATKRRGRLKAGSTPWAPYRPAMAGMNGIIDPVAEWLVENDQVQQESGEWLTVLCPQADLHTSGGDTAGYKPLGRGDDPTTRGFHCFHDSCNLYHTQDYLHFVANQGGPQAGARDLSADMVSTYVYDTINDCAWKIRNTLAPKQITMTGLRNTHPRKTLVAAGKGKDGVPKLMPVAEYTQWLTSESRVTVMGTTFDPTNPSRLVERQGDLYINQFSPPAWGTGPYDMKHVNAFTAYLEYLIPHKAEREYFTQWLAAKMQNVGFRGVAVVMVAQSFGVGRSTLADMIKVLIGGANYRQMSFDKMVGDQQYNDWLEAPFIVANESKDTGGLSCYKTYEKLKEMIDPRPTEVLINPKYGKQRTSMVHSSFLFLSNHTNALAIPEGDRRFFVITNPHTPESPEFFTAANEAMPTDEGSDTSWARSVYRWLCEVPVDMKPLLTTPPSTSGKEVMVEESRSDIDMLSRELMAWWPCEYITYNQYTDAVAKFAERLGLYDVDSYKAQLKRIFASETYPLAQKAVMKFENKTSRFRVIVKKSDENSTPRGEDLSNDDKAHIRGALIPENLAKTMANVHEALDVAGL